MSLEPFNIGNVPVGGPTPFFILGPCALENEDFAWDMARSLKEIADRTGGGDSFASGVIAALLKGKSPEDAVQWGAAHGICVQETIGDTTMVTQADVEKEVARAMKGGGVSALR